MKCPKCNGRVATVDSRDSEGLTKRRKKCVLCSHSFLTMEYPWEETPRQIEERLKKQLLAKLAKAMNTLE